MCLKKRAVARQGWLVLLVLVLVPALVLLFFYLVSDLAAVVQSYKNSRTVIAVGAGDQTMAKNYEDLASSGDITVLDDQASPSDSFENHMLDQFKADLGKARQQYIIGASFDKDQITGWFNDQPLHALPLALNMLYNAHLKSSGISLNIVNHPLPFSAKSQTSLLQGASSSVTMAITISLVLLSCYFILFPIRERTNKAKHLQIISGTNVLVFWGVHFIFDFFCFLAAFVLIIIILAIIRFNCFSTGGDIARMFAVLVCFACQNLPFIYVMSLMFTSEDSALSVLLFIYFIGLTVILGISELMVYTQYTNTLNNLKWILFSIPTSTLTDALSSLHQYCSYSDLCSKFKPNCSQVQENFCCPENCPITGCVSTPPNYFQWNFPGIGRHILAFLLWGLIFFTILLIIHSYLLNNCLTYLERLCVGMVLLFKARKHDEDDLEEDEDVINEKQKISSCTKMQLKEYNVVLRGVTKYYCALRAVNDISVGVEKGETFGLLGVNGAGKTSTFKIMTGDTRMTKGKGYLMSHSIQNETRKVHKNVGYCPQSDALIDVMTVRETLRMYLLLRGFSYGAIIREIRRITSNLDLREHIDKKVKDCSGGNKRKLSFAISLIGDRPVVFLDEPTAGLDPVIRRQVWDVVMAVRESGNSVILTSHSMEECEVLCTRLAIMVNGSFKCLGPIQHLKNKFAQGYTLIIKVKEGNDVPQRMNTVKDFIYRTFPGAVLKQEYLRLLTYNIPRKTYSWSQMFGIMEKGKKKHDIEDYSLGQTTLEQVFIHLISLQRLQK